MNPREHTGSAQVENDTGLTAKQRVFWLAQLWRTAQLAVLITHRHT